MDYKVELDVSEQKLSLVLEFLKGVSFIKNIRAVASNEITNQKILDSIEDYEKGKTEPVPLSLAELKAMTHA
jgi:hypothetical protein